MSNSPHLLPSDAIRAQAAARIAQQLKLATTWQAAVALAPHGQAAALHLCNIASLKPKLEGLLELANLARAYYGEPPAADVEAAVDQAVRQLDDILVALTTARAADVVACMRQPRWTPVTVSGRGL